MTPSPTPQPSPDQGGEQEPAGSPETAVTLSPSVAQSDRQGKVLPLVVVGGGVGGAAAGKVLIEGLGWVSRKAAMKLGPMIGTSHFSGGDPDAQVPLLPPVSSHWGSLRSDRPGHPPPPTVVGRNLENQGGGGRGDRAQPVHHRGHQTVVEQILRREGRITPVVAAIKRWWKESFAEKGE